MKKLILILMLATSYANAATYYVATTGNDNNPGTLAAPFKTITKALEYTWGGTNTIYVRAGTYHETVWVGQDNLTLSGYPSDAFPVIDGGTTSGSTLPDWDYGGLVELDGNYNTFTRFEVKNANVLGTYVYGKLVGVSGNYNTVSYVKAHHAWANGIFVQGDHNTVTQSQVYQSNLMNTAAGGNVNGWASGLSAADQSSGGSASYNTFSYNRVYNNWGEGLSCYEADHCVMFNNIVFDNYAVQVYLSDATDSTVQNNLVCVTSSPAITVSSPEGIALADEKSTKPRSSGNTITYNAIDNARLSAFSWTLVNGSGLVNTTINNNWVEGDLSTGYAGSNSITNSGSTIASNEVYGSTSDVPSNSGITFQDGYWVNYKPSLAASSTDRNYTSFPLPPDFSLCQP